MALYLGAAFLWAVLASAVDVKVNPGRRNSPGGRGTSGLPSGQGSAPHLQLDLNLSGSMRPIPGARVDASPVVTDDLMETKLWPAASAGVVPGKIPAPVFDPEKTQRIPLEALPGANPGELHTTGSASADEVGAFLKAAQGEKAAEEALASIFDGQLKPGAGGSQSAVFEGLHTAYQALHAAPDVSAGLLYRKALVKADALADKRAFHKRLDEKLAPRALRAVPHLITQALGLAEKGKLTADVGGPLYDGASFWNGVLERAGYSHFQNLPMVRQLLAGIQKDAASGQKYKYELMIQDLAGGTHLVVRRLAKDVQAAPPAPLGTARSRVAQPQVTMGGWLKGKLQTIADFLAPKPQPREREAAPARTVPQPPVTVLVHAARKIMGTALGYKLYHAAPDGYPAELSQDSAASLTVSRSGDGAEVRAARLRFDIFNSLIESNFAALELIAQGSSKMTVKNARAVLARVRSMAEAYAALSGDKGYVKRMEDGLASVAAALEAQLDGLGDGEPLPEAAVELVIPIEKASLHAYINAYHQAALDAVGRRADDEEPAHNLEVVLAEGGKSRAVRLMDLSENPIVQGGRVVSPTLRALVRALRASNDRPKGSLIMQDHQFWGHFKLGAHSAEVYANFLQPDEGGMVRVRYQEWGESIANQSRLYYVAGILERLGFAVKQEKGFLTAVVDKDHQSQSVDEMMESFSVLLQALHSTVGVDYALPIFLEGSTTREESARRVDLWVDVVMGEGALPFYKNDQAEAMVEGYRNHVAQTPLRVQLRRSLNLTLHKMGLPLIPEEAPLGQLTIDRHYNRPIEEAIARGEVRVGEDGRLLRPRRHPLALAAEELMKEGEPARMAEVVASLDPALFVFETVGAQGSLLIQRAQRQLDSDTWLIIHVLRDPDTGIIAAARAERGRLDSAPTNLSPKAVFVMLQQQGYAVAPFTPSKFPPGLDKVARKARELPQNAPALGDLFRGLAASPGHGKAVVAKVTYDKVKAAQGGYVFLAPYTTPDDLDAIRKSKAVLTTSGGLLSHAAITTREMGIPAVILGQAGWQGGRAFLVKPVLTRLGITSRVTSMQRSWLKEGDVVRVDAVTGQLEIYPENLGQAMYEVSSALELPAERLAAWLRQKLKDRSMLERYALALEVLRDIISKASLGAIGDGEILTLRAALPDDAVTKELEESLFKLEVRRAVEDITAAGEAARESTSSESVERALLRAAARLDRMTMLRLAFGRGPSEVRVLREVYASVALQAKGRLSAILEEDIAELQEHARLYPSLTMETLPKIKSLVAKARRRGLSPDFYSQWEGQIKTLEAARQRRSAPAVLPLSDVLDVDVPFVGGKAAKLGEIMQIVKAAGAEVPPGLALSVEAYRQFLREAGIADRVAKLASDPSLTPERRSAAIQQLILQGPLSAGGGVGLIITQSLKLNGMRGKMLAVRSSAVDEDGADAAFAGAGDTHLYVTEQALLEHVKQIWASLWNPRALIYREARGLSTTDIAQAVVVQVMADSEVSGIVFTQDPVSGNSGRVIVNSVWGLGEGAVSGRVAPDQYVLSKKSGREILPAMIADKKLAVVRDPVSGAGTADKKIDARIRRARSLTPAQLETLAAVAAAIENHLGYGLDIEWGYVGDKLYIMQARPITQSAPKTPAKKPAGAKKKILFVCTGNTCRSPMAEYLAKSKAAKSGLEHLEFESRGLAPQLGMPLTPMAASTLRGYEAGGAGHTAKKLSAADVAAADVILVMTPQHALQVIGQHPGAAGKVRQLGDGPIADPFNMELTPKAAEAYGRAAAQISAAVDALLAEEKK